MTEPLNRDEIIALLERLGAGDDAEALEAARALHAAIAAAGTSWEELLVPEDAGETGDTVDAEVDEPAEAGVDEPAEAETPAGKPGQNAAALALIDKLLGRAGITEAFREEMEGYKADIAEGEFADADHKYLRALAKRLSGKG
jgi:hypothetical protein